MVMFIAPGPEADPGRNGQTTSKKIATCYDSHCRMPTDSLRAEPARETEYKVGGCRSVVKWNVK